MIPALISLVSMAAFMQFFVSYTRSLIASSRKFRLSHQVLNVAGIDGNSIGGDEFALFLQLLHLCPDAGKERMGICAVKAYFDLLQPIRTIANAVSPRLASWVENERESCARFVAVVLDDRIAFNRGLVAQQAGERS